MSDTICIISFKDKDIIKVIESFSYKCIDVISSPLVSEEINYHADVLYVKIDNRIYISCCQKENYKYINEKYEIQEVLILEKGYKTESYLNFVVNDKYIIKNKKTALDIKGLNRKEILVNQGYTRCSLICLNEKAYITDDVNIYKKLKENMLDCLLLKKGLVKLKGHDYGFIGGASVFLEKQNTLLFFGDIKENEEKEKVVKFLKQYSIQPYFIKNKQLIDIGSAIILN